MEKKRTHTIEEIDELKDWFETNRNKVPANMQIDKSAFTPDLPETISCLILLSKRILPCILGFS